MARATQIAFQTVNGFCASMLENAAAGLNELSFTVLAERIRRGEVLSAAVTGFA